MKKTIKLITITLIMGLTSFVQAQKIAHIDSEKLLSLMPEKEAVDKKLIEEATKHKSALEKMQKEIQETYVKYEKEQAKVTPEINQARGKELQEKTKKLTEYQEMATKEVNKKEEELYKPILQKAQNAINEVAKEKGFDYVLSASALVHAAGYDLLNDVKIKLGIK
jgi:outer membrane protein